MKRFVLISALLCIMFIQALGQEKALGYYKIDIKQITPKAGIATGHVIAYGHYIKPPYKITLRDTIIYINGVQVMPTIESPGMVEGRKKGEEEKSNKEKICNDFIKAHKKEIDESNKIDTQAKSIYKSLKEQKGKKVAIKEAISYCKKQPSVDSVRYIGNVSEEVYVYYKKDHPATQLLLLKGYRIPAKSIHFEQLGRTVVKDDINADIGDLPKTKHGWTKLNAKQIEERLLKERVIIFSLNLKTTYYLSTIEELNKLTSILRSSDISKDQFASKNVHINPDVIDEIIDNINSEDWPKTINYR